MAYTLPDLPYAFDALEPHIDAKTMEIHHGKHHAAYVSKVNDALSGTSLEGKAIEEVLANLETLPAEKQGAVRNNGGGHFNHMLFWPSLQGGGAQSPTGALASAIEEHLGGFERFKESFATAAATRFGSGWAWLCVDPGKSLHVCSTANQDTTFMAEGFGGLGSGHTPILGLDVWEHAYYLNYQNRRPDYIAAFWNVVNWSEVGARYERAVG